MNEDYLWDKSGPPDPEIQQLESILGTLRYEPKPFEIPSDVPAPRGRNYLPLLAIAATLLLALLAGGIWLRVRTRNQAPAQQAAVPEVPRTSTPEEKLVPKHEPQQSPNFREQQVAVNYRRRNRPAVLDQREREEAFAAKEQVMLALRLASEKLNLAQRKTQGTSPANQIKNQHRVG